ncbi:hypothetical protein [Micromonospora sp. NPDC005174]|uniref:hypothetical protein n=1 Tax=Micromonospora sp. NPDC005174 TaxID=3157018 RepID=UPI0033BDE9CA
MTEQDWRATRKTATRVWLSYLAEKVKDRGWTGVEDWADPNLPAVLTLTDEDGTIEVTVRPSAEYRPTI